MFQMWKFSSNKSDFSFGDQSVPANQILENLSKFTVLDLFNKQDKKIEWENSQGLK